MKIYIAGSGLIGRSLHKNLVDLHNKNIYLLSIRNLSLEKINNIIMNISNNDVFIDSMDPNSINNDINQDHLKKIKIIRSNALSLSKDFHYIFLSTASLYKQNYHFIDERMTINKFFKSKYLEMKFQNEKLVKSSCKSPLTIARLVSIWSDENQDSFFGDLIKALKEKRTIKPRDGDDTVISYISLNDACKLLSFIILKKITGTLNISTDQYNSRSNMKAIVNNSKTKPISNLSGLRINSSKLNWKEIIGKREELF